MKKANYLACIAAQSYDIQKTFTNYDDAVQYAKEYYHYDGGRQNKGYVYDLNDCRKHTDYDGEVATEYRLVGVAQEEEIEDENGMLTGEYNDVYFEPPYSDYVELTIKG